MTQVASHNWCTQALTSFGDTAMRTTIQTVLLGLALLTIAAGISSKYHDPSDALFDKIISPKEPPNTPKPPSVDDAIMGQ